MAETILRLSFGAIREDFLPVHPSLSGPVRVWHSDRSSPSPIFDNRLCFFAPQIPIAQGTMSPCCESISTEWQLLEAPSMKVLSERNEVDALFRSLWSVRE